MPGTAQRVVSSLGGEGYDGVDDSLSSISSSMLELKRTYASIAVTNVETTMFVDDAPTRISCGSSIKIDLTAMQAGDTFDFKTYYRLTSGGGWFEAQDKTTKAGAQATPLLILDLEAYRYGIKVTGQRTAGTDKNIPIEAIVET